MKVAFLGPEGTFSEEALLTSATGEDVEPVPMPTIYECVMAVADGRCERALVPIENSLEGSVNATLDALVFETDQVQIAGEVVHPITHTLIARTQLPLDQIERVLSHPQASAQCAKFLRERLSQAEVVGAQSTADAVRIVAEADRPWAALGNHISAELYGCEVLADRVEDTPANETRFVWLTRSGRLPTADGGRQFKTSIVFWGMSDHPGALVDVLQEFAARKINLSKIESRPRKQGLGRYVFFADLVGRADDPPVVEALDAIGNAVETLRVLGCYPAAGLGAPACGYTFRSAVEAATATVTPAGPAGQGRETDRESEPAGEPVAASRGVPRRSDGGRVLVLNASYEPLNVCTVRRAVVLVLKEKAELVEKGERAVRAESVTLPHPVVIRLVTYVRIPRDQRRRRITRRAVFARDSWTCQYCGTTSHLTVDHVIPRSRGGPSDWENIVTSCAPCNRRKGNRTTVETGMHPRRKPRAPGPTIFIRVAAPVVPTAWQQYLL